MSDERPIAAGAAATSARPGDADLLYWQAWIARRYGQPLRLPLAPEVVVQFVLDHAAPGSLPGAGALPPEIDRALVNAGIKRRLGPYRLRTIARRVAALARAHRDGGHPDPRESHAVRQVLRPVLAGRQCVQPIASEQLERILALCDDGRLRGKRDRALLLLTLAGAGLTSEMLARIEVQDLERRGPGNFVLTIPASGRRAGPRGIVGSVALDGAAGQALERWLRAARIGADRVFRRVRGQDRVGSALTAAEVRHLLRTLTARRTAEVAAAAPPQAAT